jgi:hypothetical protein
MILYSIWQLICLAPGHVSHDHSFALTSILRLVLTSHSHGPHHSLVM